MKFKSWVAKNGGAGALAEKLGITPYGVRIWMRREGSPKISTMEKIVKLSSGDLTFEDIIRDTRETRASGGSPRKSRK